MEYDISGGEFTWNPDAPEKDEVLLINHFESWYGTVESVVVRVRFNPSHEIIIDVITIYTTSQVVWIETIEKFPRQRGGVREELVSKERNQPAHTRLW
jgi:hypothetical protein